MKTDHQNLFTIRTLYRELATYLSLIVATFSASDISIFHKFQKPPSGGGNQFLFALTKELSAQGYRVEKNRISKTSKACLFNSYNFDIERLQKFLRTGVKVVHRVDGPISIYRGVDDCIDQYIYQVNQEFADATIFQSEYSLKAHIDLGMKFKEPHVIMNSVDQNIFHPGERLKPSTDRKIRLITTSWSDNPNKGLEIYSWLDENLDWSQYEYTYVGRCLKQFKNIRYIKPVNSINLAKILRQHDIFIAGSIHDPCSNSLLEALNCGCPAIYRNSGGHSEIVGKAGLGFDSSEEIPSLIETLTADFNSFQNSIRLPNIIETTTNYLKVLGINKPNPSEDHQ